jgi:ADP-ribose pyrophosphatase YjhB (NUDIX family)
VLLQHRAPWSHQGGTWGLPGGARDSHETPEQAAVREIAEETGQPVRVTGLLGVSHGHHPRALGPEGYALDWHTVRVHYRAKVDIPTQPVVNETGGSTADAAWFTRRELAGIRLTPMATEVVVGLLRYVR